MVRRSAALLPVLGALCLPWASCVEESGTVEQDPELPSPYTYDQEEPAEPTLDAAALGAAIEQVAVEALEMPVDPAFDAYFTAMADADAYDCPARYAEDTGAYTAEAWQDECAAASGATYSGYAYLLTYDGYEPGDGYSYDGHYLYLLSGEVVTADGHTFTGSGAIQALVATNASTVIHYKSVLGAFSWDGPGAAGTWLEQGVSPSITVGAAWFPDYDAGYVQIEGGIGAGTGDTDTVYMTGVVLYDAVLGSTCDQEPSGSVSVRDLEGSWYDVLFDGPGEDGNDVDPAVCDGCGATWYRGAAIGETCADFSALLSWEEVPW